MSTIFTRPFFLSVRSADPLHSFFILGSLQPYRPLDPSSDLVREIVVFYGLD